MSTSHHQTLHPRSLPAPLAPIRAPPRARRPPPPPLLLRLPLLQDHASLFASSPLIPLPDPQKPLIYFDASSEKAGKLRKLLLNQTQDFTSFITTTISEASHVLVEPPSFLGDLLLRAHAQSSSSSSTSSSLLRPQYILCFRWLEDSIRLQTWQPEEGYLYVPEVAKDRQGISQSSVEGREVVAVVDPNKQVVPSFRFSSNTTTTITTSIPQPRPTNPFARTVPPHPTSTSLSTSSLEPPSFLRFGVAPSSSSSRPASFCWFCASEANETNTLKRTELAEVIEAGSGEVMRFARYGCPECVRAGWVELNAVVGGASVGGAEKLRSLQELIWFTRKLKERGLEKRRVRVRVEDGGTAETSSSSSSSSSARTSSAQVLSSMPVSTTTVIAHPLPVVPSKRPSPSTSSEPSPSKKSRVETSIDASRSLPTSKPPRHPSPSSPPLDTPSSFRTPKLSSTVASKSTLNEAVRPQPIASPPLPPPVASLPNQPITLPSSSSPSTNPIHPSPPAPPHPTSPLHPSSSNSEPPTFLNLGVPPSTNICTPTLPFCYFCGTGTLESNSFKTLDLADELPPDSGTFVRVEARLACEFCVERYESRLPAPTTKEGDGAGEGLKRLATVTKMLKENGLRERRMLVHEGGMEDA